jgi:hypothetical protein
MGNFGKFWCNTLLAIVFVVFEPWCSAVGQTASVRGTVFDPDHSVVAQADVELYRRAAGPLVLQTDTNGTFDAENVPPGTYALEVKKEGFAAFRKEKIAVSARGQVNLRIVLSLPVYQEEVNVDSSDDAKGTSLGENNLSEKTIRQMSDDPDTFRQELTAMIGPDALYRLNGLDIDVNSLPSKDLIRAIRISTGTFSAEYGASWSFMVDIFTDPSKVKFGGSVMARGTTTAMSAQNPFAPKKAPYDEIFGRASLRGHIGKKLSYGGTLGRSYSDTGSIVNAQVLNSALEQVNDRDAVSSGTHGVSGELVPGVSLGGKDDSTGYFRARLNTANNLGVGGLNLVGHSYTQRETAYTARISSHHTFTANTINEFLLDCDGITTKQRSLTADPEVVVTGAFTGGGNSIGDSTSDTHNFTIKDVLRTTVNRHLMAIGVEAHRFANDDSMANNFNGTFTFSSLNAYQITMQGLAAGTSASQIRANGGGASQFQITAGQNAVSASQPDIAGFVQDNVDLRSNIGISYGLRMEAQRTLPGVSVAPRVSLKWGIDGNAKKPARTSLQVSLGVFYNRFPLASVTNVARYQSNKTAQYTYINPDFFPTIPENLEGETSATPSLYAFSPHLHASYMTRENVSLSRAIGKEGHLYVGFYHSLGQRQYDERNVNSPLPGTYDSNDPGSGVRPTGKLENIFQYESEQMNKGSEFNANYMGQLMKHVTFGGGMGANFANGDDYGPPSNPYSLKDDYGRLGSRQPYGSFFASIEVPRVGVIQPSLFFHPGQPMNITLGEDLNGDTIYNDRPAFVTSLDSTTVVKTKYGNFETNPGPTEKRIPVNFANGPMSVMVNLSFSREIPLHFLEYPGGRFKPSMNFSADGDNILNHPNLSTPQGSLNSPLFGKSTSTSSDARDFRFNTSLRF